MDCSRLCVIILFVNIATCTLSKPEKKTSKIKGKAADENKAEKIPGDLDKEAVSRLVATMHDAGELDEEEVATFYSIMDKMKGNLEIFSSKHEEVDALKNKFQTQIKGLEKLHDEMRETQKKMAIEQEFFEQQQQQFNQMQKELQICQDDSESFGTERKGWEKEVSRLVKDLKLADDLIQEEKKMAKICQKDLNEIKTQNSQLKEKLTSTQEKPDTGKNDLEKEVIRVAYEEERQVLVDKIAHLQAQLDQGGGDLSRDAVIKRKDERIAFFNEEKMRLVDRHREKEEMYQRKLDELQVKFEEASRSGPSAGYIEELQRNVKELDGKVSFLQAESAHLQERYTELKMLNADSTRSVNHWNLKYVDCMRNNTKLEEEVADVSSNNKDLLELASSNEAKLLRLKEENKNAMSVRDVSVVRLKEIDRQCKQDIKALNADLEKCQSHGSKTVSSLKSCEDMTEECKRQLENNDKSQELTKKNKMLQYTVDRLESQKKRDQTLHEETKSSLREQSTKNSICQMKLETTSKSLEQKSEAIKDLSKTCSTLGECEFDKEDLQRLYDKALTDCSCKPVEEIGEEGETVINRFEIIGNVTETPNEKFEEERRYLEEQKATIQAKLSEQYKVTDELRATSNDIRDKMIKYKGDVETLTMQQRTLHEKNLKCKMEMEQLESKTKGGSVADEDDKSKLKILEKKLAAAQDDESNCQETLTFVRTKHKTSTEALETLQTDHSDLLAECEELYEDYKKCDVEKQQLGLKAGGVDLIIQKMEDDHQKKMAKADENLQSAVRSEMELFWSLLVTILLCIVFGYYSCYSYFRNKYRSDEKTKKKVKDSKKRR